MTAINTFRPHLGRAAMLLVSAAALLLVAAPKAGAWDETVGDFTVSRERSGYSYGDVTVSAYTGSDTDITFPSKVTYGGTEYNVTAVGSNVLSKLAGVDGTSITVTIPEGYTSIDGNAFTNCYGLKSITIPGSVTKINYNAFENCKNLAAVTFADSNSNLSFGNKVFLNCISLNNLTLPARLNDLGAGIFQGCTSLTDLTTSADNASYLIQDGIVYAKNDDSDSYTLHSYLSSNSASSLTVPSEVNGKPVTAIFRLAFQNNSTLQSVTIPAGVADLKSSCFEGCSALKKVSIEAENPTFGGAAFVGLPKGSVIEVANDTAAAALEPSVYYTYYTADNTTVTVKGTSAPQTSSAELTAKGTGVKDGYAYYKLTLDNAENVKTMLLHMSFDASKVSKDAQAAGKKAAYAKLNDDRFSVISENWTEEDGKVHVRLALMPKDNGKAVTGTDAAKLLLLALPVNSGVVGKIDMTVEAVQCAGISTEDDSLLTGTVTVNGSPASNRVTSYDVYADDKIDILDITEAQRFYQMSSTDENWTAAQKADVNGDDKVDIQDLIDIFLQIEF